MPIKHAAFKALRQSEKRTIINKQIKEGLKTIIKKVRRLITEKKKDEAAKMVQAVMKALDKAAQKGVIKKNTAARKKSRLTRQFNALK